MIIDQMHLSDLIFPHKELPENEEHVVRDLRVHNHLSNLDPAVEISPDSRKKDLHKARKLRESLSYNQKLRPKNSSLS